MSLFLFLLLAAACSRFSTTAESLQPDNTPELIVSGDSSGFPDGCSPRQVADLILQFFEAYNNGQQDHFAQTFPQNFDWYSDGIGSGDNIRHFVTHNREELLAYFAERYQQGERLQLLAISVVGPANGRGGIAHIAWSYRRQADDIRPGPDGVTRIGGGKGAIHCRSQKVFVWSMGVAAWWEDEEFYLWDCSHASTSTGAVPSAEVCVIYKVAE